MDYTVFRQVIVFKNNIMAKFYNVCLTAVAMIVGAASLQARPLVVAGNLLTSDSQGAVYEITSDGSKTRLTYPA